MRTMYDDDTLRQINEATNIVDYASQTMELTKRGGNLYAHCPKHNDDTPSLCFSPDKNFYYCFSCGRSGGIIKFLMDYEGLCFQDAVEKAAKLAEIDLSKICHSDTVMFLKKVKALSNKKDEQYDHQILGVQEYLKYKQEPIQEWIQEGISPDVMELFGVRADTYQNRIIYPVYDINGELLNIKGRTRYANYKALKIPKYINYYPVGVMDYFQGLNITLSYIKEANEAIIFESIKSVMKAYGWGYRNCISAEKHTLTNEQINLLAKLKVNIVFAYDTDVSYHSQDVRRNIEKLKRITNVYIIKDPQKLLGGAETKNAPVDLGRDIWEQLYRSKKKVK